MKMIWIGLRSQELRVYESEHLQDLETRPCLMRCDVSTGQAGIGEREGSAMTPRGWHHVAEKVGHEAPLGAVFVARQWTGEIYPDQLNTPPNQQRDWILTRILWLAGDEPGLNAGQGCDSYARYIYIHGTPDENPLGQALSKGCIRMHSKDLMALFEVVAVGTPVYLAEQG